MTWSRSGPMLQYASAIWRTASRRARGTASFEAAGHLAARHRPNTGVSEHERRYSSEKSSEFVDTMRGIVAEQKSADQSGWPAAAELNRNEFLRSLSPRPAARPGPCQHRHEQQTSPAYDPGLTR